MSQSPQSSGKALLVACDGCHSRKVKCDRTSPCGNCRDANVKCRRDRPTLPRKPRKNISDQVSESIQELKDRVSMLEDALSQVLENSNRPHIDSPRHYPSFGEVISPMIARKRTAAAAFTSRNIQHANSPSDAAYTTPLFSVSEAQNAIRKEIESAPNLSEKRRAVFNAAINSLKQSLDASEGEGKQPYGHGSLQISRDALRSPSIPSPELIHWIMQPRKLGDSAPWALQEFMPLLSKKSFVKMYQQLYETKDGNYDLTNLLCVTAATHAYMMEAILPETEESGMENIWRAQAIEYLATARAAVSQISLLAAPSLANLQALCIGVSVEHLLYYSSLTILLAIVSQEAGDMSAAWALTTASCSMCIQLNLHLKDNQFSHQDTPREVVFEVYYCLTFCFLSDKGLSMSLGRSPVFKDAEFEIDLLKKPDPENGIPSYEFYVDLAKLQSALAQDLQGVPNRRDAHQVDATLDRLLNEMDRIWKNIKAVETETKIKPRAQRLDSDLEWMMMDFTFYSVKATLLTVPALSHETRTRCRSAALDAARASLLELKKARQFAYQDSQPMETLKSIAHWTILYFPFTSFFILFCNVATTNYMPDYAEMKGFVSHLSDIKDTSPAMAKLYNLCQAFCSLAATLLSTPETTAKARSDGHNTSNNDNSPRKRLKHAATHPEMSGPMQHNTTSSSPFPMSDIRGSPTVAMGPPTMMSSYNSEVPVPVSGIGYEPIPYVDSDSSLWQLLDTQPRLQWLDTDLSAFDDMWGDPNLYQDSLPRY